MIVEQVEPGSVAEQAGIGPGCRLIGSDGKTPLSPAALLGLEECTFGGKSVTLCGEWEGHRLEFAVKPGNLGITARPDLPAEVQAEYERGQDAYRAQRFAEAARYWSEAARHVADEALSAWLHTRVGAARERAADWEGAQDAYLSACTLLQNDAETAQISAAWTALGRCSQSRNDFDAAAAWYERARQADERAHRQVGVARNLNCLGRVAFIPGDLDAAWDHYTRALELCERHAPDSLCLAMCVNNVGTVAYFRGNLTAAQDHFTRALALRERFAPGSLDVAGTLNNLGIVAADCGDLASAQDYFTRSLDIRERFAPGSLDVAMTLNNVGNIAYYRGDLDTAGDFHSRALAIRQRLTPDSLDVAASLNNLGLVALDRRHLDTAWDDFTRSLSIRTQLAPDSQQVAVSLYNLGEVALIRGDLDAARDYFTRVLAIRERIEPGSIDHADTLELMGQIDLRTGHPAEAVARIRCAVEIIEQVRAEIVAPEIRALLLAQHTRKYGALIQGYLAHADIESAFATLERSRARSLLELLTDRHLDLAADAPPELILQQRELDERRADAYAQLSGLAATAANEPQIEALHRALRDLERRQQQLAAQIRAASPRYADLQYPQPLDLKAAQATLDPDTLLLSYFVDEEQTFLFAVSATHRQAIPLPVGRKALQAQVHAFRRSLDFRLLENDPRTATALGSELYTLLIGPMQPLVRDARRLLICPDGPLHALPFAALVTKVGRKPQYLGTERPLHSTASVTLYAQSRQRGQAQVAQEQRNQTSITPGVSRGSGRADAPLPRLLAFGDPIYVSNGHVANGHAPAAVRAGTGSASEVSPLQMRGLALEPLPYSRQEVESLALLFAGSATVKLGAEATKTAVLQASADADIVHFACHGWLDAQMPLSSSLVLSQPEALGEQAPPGDNGLLQAWEIMQRMRLKANLVVLSACQTGLGQEVQGEGLMGLTRAFQYAGARSLVVSLWDINDAGTSHFMQAFYRALKTGIGKDDALRAAIKTLQAAPQWNHPYYWSAFVLVGDRN